MYELVTSSYIAQGGSGYNVLKHNTTQFDTKVQQRDALIDYIRSQPPCGWDPSHGTDDGLQLCSVDADCPQTYVCACPDMTVNDNDTPGRCQSKGGACGSDGRCVLQQCRDDVATAHTAICSLTGSADLQTDCEQSLGACQTAGETCKYLACINQTVGSYSDNRVYMIAP